jgi:hypothetical protein
MQRRRASQREREGAKVVALETPTPSRPNVFKWPRFTFPGSLPHSLPSSIPPSLPPSLLLSLPLSLPPSLSLLLLVINKPAPKSCCLGVFDSLHCVSRRFGSLLRLQGVADGGVQASSCRHQARLRRVCAHKGPGNLYRASYLRTRSSPPKQFECACKGLALGACVRACAFQGPGHPHGASSLANLSFSCDHLGSGFRRRVWLLQAHAMRCREGCS